MALQPQQTLQKGKYTIERSLGQGRFGMTYLATRSPENDRCIIKILKPDALGGLSRNTNATEQSVQGVSPIRT
jgi:serine/threonine protein kinase